jgi:hypothetical protein
MFKLKDPSGNDISVGSQILAHGHGVGIVRGTTLEGKLEVRIQPSKKLGDKIDYTYVDKVLDPSDVLVCVSSYHLIIDEDQRLALMTLLRNNPHSARDGGPLEAWIDMLGGLPKDELDAPGCHHGFCL